MISIAKQGSSKLVDSDWSSTGTLRKIAFQDFPSLHLGISAPRELPYLCLEEQHVKLFVTRNLTSLRPESHPPIVFPRHCLLLTNRPLPMFQLFNCSIAQPFVRRSGETNCHPRGICSLISRIQENGHSSFPAFWNCLKRRVRMFSKVCLRVSVAINRNRLPPARHRLHLELSETVIQMSPLH